MAMAAMNMVSAGGFSGVSFHLRTSPQGGRLCTLQENPHFWVQAIKVRPSDGILTHIHTCSLYHFYPKNNLRKEKLGSRLSQKEGQKMKSNKFFKLFVNGSSLEETKDVKKETLDMIV
jgi:hypothetical protein